MTDVDVERPALLSYADAARLLGVSLRTIKRSVTEGRIRTVRLTSGGRRRIVRASIEDLLRVGRDRSHLEAWHAGREAR